MPLLRRNYEGRDGPGFASIEVVASGEKLPAPQGHPCFYAPVPNPQDPEFVPGVAVSQNTVVNPPGPPGVAVRAMHEDRGCYQLKDLDVKNNLVYTMVNTGAMGLGKQNCDPNVCNPPTQACTCPPGTDVWNINRNSFGPNEKFDTYILNNNDYSQAYLWCCDPNFQARGMDRATWQAQCHDFPIICNDYPRGLWNGATSVSVDAPTLSNPWDRRATLHYSAAWDGVSCMIEVFDSTGKLIDDVNPALYRGSNWDINGVALDTPKLNRSFIVGNNVRLQPATTYTYNISNCATNASKDNLLVTP
jgi:hypothetical protein